MKGYDIMKLFIDTANVDDIRWANDLGVICGVTTNPSLIAKEGRVFEEVVKEITTIVDGPISAEVISLEADKMVEEALPLAAIHKNIVIKLPMCEEGLKACKMLTAKGIKTDGTRLEEKALHPTAIIAVNAQASLAADGPYAEKCVRRFWNTPLRTGERRYYDNFLYLFAMLALSGNYRIYR